MRLHKSFHTETTPLHEVRWLYVVKGEKQKVAFVPQLFKVGPLLYFAVSLSHHNSITFT